MTDPFTEPSEKGSPPYWLRDTSQRDLWTHRRLIRKLEELFRFAPEAPKNRKRSWHID